MAFGWKIPGRSKLGDAINPSAIGPQNKNPQADYIGKFGDVTDEQLRSTMLEFYDQVERGEATKRDGLVMLTVVGPRADAVCREFGDASERCTNMKALYQQLYNFVMSLPDDAPSTYGLGTLAVVGLASAIVGGAAVYFTGRK